MAAAEDESVVDDVEDERRNRELPATEALPPPIQKISLPKKKHPILPTIGEEEEEEDDVQKVSRPSREAKLPARYQDFLMSAFREVLPFEGEDDVLEMLFQ